MLSVNYSRDSYHPDAFSHLPGKVMGVLFYPQKKENIIPSIFQYLSIYPFYPNLILSFFFFFFFLPTYADSITVITLLVAFLHLKTVTVFQCYISCGLSFSLSHVKIIISRAFVIKKVAGPNM